MEEVTCDRCGVVATFEKFRQADNLVRFEHIDTWLLTLGWALSDGIRHGHFCPVCITRNSP
jgi:hypothetical protein